MGGSPGGCAGGSYRAAAALACVPGKGGAAEISARLAAWPFRRRVAEGKQLTGGAGLAAARGGRGRRVTAGADRRALLVRGTTRTQARCEALGCGERGASWAERWTVAG